MTARSTAGVREFQRDAARGRRQTLRTRSIRTRLLFFITATLVAVCVAMTPATVAAPCSSLLGAVDERVTKPAERSLGGVSVGPRDHTELAFLREQGQASGTLAARFDDKGNITSAEVIGTSGEPEALTAVQRAALDGIGADGSTHTRTVPGLGTYRITALSADGLHLLTGLPMDDVQDMISGLVVVEAVVAGVGLTMAGCVCAVVIRRQLRPLDGSPRRPSRPPALSWTGARSPA